MIEKDVFNIEFFNNVLRGIRLNCNKGMTYFFDTYQEEIIKIVFRITKSTTLAKEVVNDVLISVWRFANKKKTVGNPHGFLFVVVVNRLKDKFKAQKKHEPLYDSLQVDIDYMEQVIAEDKFNYLLAKLTEAEKEIVICKIKDKMTFQEIAEKRNQPLSTVSSLFYRAIKKIEKNFFKNN